MWTTTRGVWSGIWTTIATPTWTTASATGAPGSPHAGDPRLEVWRAAAGHGDTIQVKTWQWAELARLAPLHAGAACRRPILPPLPPPLRRYIQPRSRESCRVYYSCDTKLKGWVPAPVYTILSKTAIKQATIWVNNEAVAQWERMKAEHKANDGPLGLGAHLREARQAWSKVLPPAKRKAMTFKPRELAERLRPPWARPAPTPVTLRRSLAEQVPTHC